MVERENQLSCKLSSDLCVRVWLVGNSAMHTMHWLWRSWLSVLVILCFRFVERSLKVLPLEMVKACCWGQGGSLLMEGTL